MHAFNRALYLEEMSGLLDTAAAAFCIAYRDIEVYTVSVWTDPNAAMSAVSFDTAKHSAAAVSRSGAWAAKQYARLIAAGEHDAAQTFAPRPGARCENPADFALRNAAEVHHKSFQPGWSLATAGHCWDTLGPALRIVQAEVVRRYADLCLHPDALVAINSSLDWYDEPVRLRRSPT